MEWTCLWYQSLVPLGLLKEAEEQKKKKKKKQDIKWILILVITVNNFTLLLMKTNVALANEEKLNCLAKV